MKTKELHKDTVRGDVKSTGENPEGYPEYPPDEDIYNKFIEDDDVDLEEITNAMEIAPQPGKIPKTTEPLSQLDIPGAELDDPEEFIGSEDEENNYYSLGGDNHENLEEDKGD